MSSQVLVWLAAVAAIVILARLRGWRGIKILLVCLLAVLLGVTPLELLRQPLISSSGCLTQPTKSSVKLH